MRIGSCAHERITALRIIRMDDPQAESRANAALAEGFELLYASMAGPALVLALFERTADESEGHLSPDEGVVGFPAGGGYIPHRPPTRRG
jgi:hypothetical protein